MKNPDQKPSAIPEVDLSGYTLDAAVVKLIPASLAEKHKVIPLFKVGNTLTLAMADPKNIMAMDEVRGITKLDVSVVKASVSGIEEAISSYYGITGIVDSVLKD